MDDDIQPRRDEIRMGEMPNEEAHARRTGRQRRQSTATTQRLPQHDGIRAFTANFEITARDEIHRNASEIEGLRNQRPYFVDTQLHRRAAPRAIVGRPHDDGGSERVREHEIRHFGVWGHDGNGMFTAEQDERTQRETPRNVSSHHQLHR